MSLLGETYALFPLLGLWLGWTLIATTAGWIALSTRPENRPDAAAVLAANVANIVLMEWLLQTQGFSALVLLPHLLFWFPLAVFLVIRTRREKYLRLVQKVTAWTLAATIIGLLVLDAVALTMLSA